MLMTATPDLYVGYVRELDARPSGPPDPAVVGETISRYATEVVAPHA
jgi:hypothetical protein